MKALFLIALLAVPGAFAQATAPSCVHDAQTFRCVRYLKNYDGDTITVEIPGVHPLLGERISVRVLGIDTPEKNGKKPCEKERAREAQRLAESLLRNARVIELRKVGRDKYFRVLAEVWIDGRSLGEVLIKNRLAYLYDGGRKPASMSWCR
jgi:endonuclease YncB( thermonuclease family)